MNWEEIGYLAIGALLGGVFTALFMRALYFQEKYNAARRELAERGPQPIGDDSAGVKVIEL